MRNYLCELVVPAIQDKWPDEDVGRTIWIQQDNAKPHILPDDEAFRQAVAMTDLDIRLLQQPPQSPDMNVLDLCFFRSLQSLTDTLAPSNIRELIEGVEEEYNNYDVDKLSRSFLTLQTCMIAVMEKGGGIDYDIPHIYKNRIQAEGRLGSSLTISADLLVKTRDLIRAAEVQTQQHSPPLPKIKQRASNEKENKQRSAHSREPHSVGAGLQNMGNTCFLNATLQCITHTVPLFQKLHCRAHSTPCSYDEDGFCSFCSLKKHMKESIQRSGSGSVLVPERFTNNLSKLNPGFIQGQQEDAHEFLRCLLDNLHKCTLDNTFDEESIVKQVFGGQLKSQLTCRDCGHCSEILEPFLDLSLEIDKVDNLVAALESFTKVEQIGDVDCDSCNAQVCKDKRFVIDKAPDVVAFHLKRFNTIEKIEKHVEYPLELDLKLFHSTPEKEDLKYDLYGVVEHSGSANFGHYVSTIRSSPSSWHLMNDSLVDSITETSALHQEAYILFYVRQGKFPWFSNLPSPMSALDNGHDVFAYHNLVTEHPTNMKKPKAASASKSSKTSSLDKNASRLMKGMMSARRNCLVNRLDTHNVLLC